MTRHLMLHQYFKYNHDYRKSKSPLPNRDPAAGWLNLGGVDWLDDSFYSTDTGHRAVDLNHTGPSSISTVIPTVAGNVYDLSLRAATVLSYGDIGAVSAGSLVNQSFTAIPSSWFDVMKYTPFSFFSPRAVRQPRSSLRPLTVCLSLGR